MGDNARNCQETAKKFLHCPKTTPPSTTVSECAPTKKSTLSSRRKRLRGLDHETQNDSTQITNSNKSPKLPVSHKIFLLRQIGGITSTKTQPTKTTHLEHTPKAALQAQ